MDDRSRTYLLTVNPKTWPAFTLFWDKANGFLQEQGYHVIFISGSRTYAQQNALYAQGRTTPGKIVTNAKGGQSYHNFASAIDVGIFDASGEYVSDEYKKISKKAIEDLYKSLGPVGESCELSWGGRWTSSQDYPHYEYNPLHLSIAQMRDRVASGQSLFS